ncbi:gem-associated protein 8-like [Artemia franciscana]|nr:hypothetical protein QYM36_004428 [Artemia franciscana]
MQEELIELINSSFASGFNDGQKYIFRKKEVSNTYNRPNVYDKNAPNGVALNEHLNPLKNVENCQNLLEKSYSETDQSPSRPKRERTSVSNSLRSSSFKRIKESVSEREILENTETEDVHLTVDKDFIQFLKISMDHKKEREELKSQREKEEKMVEFIDVSNVPYSSESGRGYWREMKKKKLEEEERTKHNIDCYGEDLAQVISGMEMAMQLNFQRKCHQTKPAYWPIVPLNFG